MKIVQCDNPKCTVKVRVPPGCIDVAMPVKLAYKGDFEFCSMRCLMNWSLQQPEYELEAIKVGV